MERCDIYVGIGANGIRVFNQNKKKEWKVAYTPGTIEKLEVKDPAHLEKWWKEVLTKLEIHKKKVLVILEEEIVFYKTVNNEEEATQFFKEVPLNALDLMKKTVKIGSEIVVMANNKSLSETGIRQIKENKCRIPGVFPGFIFAGKMPAEIIKLKEMPENMNFLDLYQITADEENKSGKVKKEYIIAGLVILGLAVLVGWLLLPKPVKVISNPPTVFQTPPEIVNTTPTSQATASAEKEKMSDVSGLKVRVLNASGITGKAKEIAEYLASKGFVNVETGNITGDQYTGIVIKVKANKDLADKLYEDLNSDYQAATPEMELAGTSDAEIIVGK